MADRPELVDDWSSQERVERYTMVFREASSIVRAKDADLVPVLISALTTPEQSVHVPAFHILRGLTGTDNPFVPFGSNEERAAASKRWSEWWDGVSGDFRLPDWKWDLSTLIVDEIPGRIVGNDDEPPGRVFHESAAGDTLLDIYSLKMPYDAVALADGNYLVNIIRARAVWKVTPDGEVLWEVGVGGYPCSLQLLPDGHFLVAGWDDDKPGFVREFDADGNEVWKIENLRWPWKAERLENGNTLIADAGTNRVFEVNGEGREVWAVENLGPEEPALFDSLGPVFCQRLDDGNTLVSIRGLSKVVEIDRDGAVVWEVGGDIVLNQYSAVRLWNGNTLIADQGHHRVIEIDVDKNIVWERGGFGYPAKAYRF